MSESWTWRYQDASGAALPDAGTAAAFPTQADAEAYLSQSWEDLADQGVGAVTLLRDDDPVYGPMSLEQG